MHIRTGPIRAAALTGLLTAVVAASGCGTGTTEETAIADPLAVTYDGGIHLLDGTTLVRGGGVELAGFNRVNPAGDDRHIIVSTSAGFRVFDAVGGQFTDIEFPGPKPGHVVRHAGRTVLFADGTGTVTSFDPAELAEGAPKTSEYRAAEAHHGVAVELESGELAVTLGTEEERVGLAILDADRQEITRSEQCPGVHGEATAAGDTLVVGCQNGVLVYRDGKLTKVTSPDSYGRIGNQAGSDGSPIVLGDYKKDEHAELERPEQISLIDTETGTIRLVDIGTSYTFRSLARGPEGEALVLGTDGGLRVIDPETGKVVRTIDVLDPWQEPIDWQQPRPALFVRDGIAYVSDTATKQIHRIDLASGTVTASVTLAETPNEISGVVAS
ncbi:zinc metallochaperone AztD [Nocardia zapadnayensis]|uniref:zinc metallochaperone AztD n=1 Tax=Nocardia rhamnosiphila TaxID=426716 RepID=UPI002246F422|nr:zinc metallochaperone AztD [Nocardia zapadnayensis]MCX0274788.1 zinc metallochaperone AztD [Nocardia zapadnayensis]